MSHIPYYDEEGYAPNPIRSLWRLAEAVAEHRAESPKAVQLKQQAKKILERT
jgi:hypothetical protein